MREMRLRKWMGRTALLTALLLAVTGSAFAAYSCYTLEDVPQDLNGAESSFTLEVVP